MDTPTVNERSLAMGRAMGKRAMLYLGILVFAFALLLLVSSSNASAADVYVSGSVSGTWSTGDNIYVVADATVDAGDTLTIQDGVNVYFDLGTSLTVNGRLLANATGDDPLINFTSNATSPASGDWVGIIFSDALAPMSFINGAHISYATNGVAVTDSNVGLSNIIIDHITGTGVVIQRIAVAADLTITLDGLFITDAGEGINIQSFDRNLTVTVQNSIILNVDGSSIYVATASGWIDLTVDDCEFVNCGDGIIVETIGPEGASDATVDVADCEFTDLGGSAVSVEALLDSADVTVSEVTVSNAQYGVYIRAYADDIDLAVDGLTADGIGTAGIQAWCDGTNDISLSNIVLNDTGVEGLGFQSWSEDIVATVDGCELTNISFLNAIVFNCLEGSVDATVTDVEIGGSMSGAAIWISANLTATVTIEDVEIAGSEVGVYLASAYGTANLDLVDVTISDPNLNQGIIVVAEDANAVVGISGVTIEMNPNIDYDSDPDFDGINVMANTTIEFVAVDLTVIGGYDCVQLTTSTDDMSVDISGALMTDGPHDGLLMNSGGELELSIVDSAFIIDVDILYVVPYFVTTTAIYGSAVEDVEAVLAGVDMQWLNGVVLVAGQEYIDVAMTDVSIEPIANDSFSAAASGIYLACFEGSATVDLAEVDCMLGASEVTWYTSGNGIVVEANDTVVFNAVNLTVIGAALDGVSVTSYNGAIEADISLADIEDIGGSGMLFYSEYDFVDLTLADSVILDCGLDGVVVQAVTEVDLEFDNVSVDGALDGVFVLSTDGDVLADFSDTVVEECQMGIRILAPNGGIEMELDPSWVGDAGTGIYLDAMGEVDLSIYDSFVGYSDIGIEIHSFDGGINVLLDNVELAYNDVYGLFADADNSDIVVTAINGTIMTENWVGWYLITSNGSVPINLEDITFELGGTGVWVESSDELIANVVDSQFLGQEVLGMNLNSDDNITLNVEGSTFDGQTAENAQLFYPSMSDGEYIIIQPEDGNWTADQGMMADLPFDFDFNGATYDEVLMSLNGWLAFGSDGMPDEDNIETFGPSAPNLIAPAQENWTADDDEMNGYFHGMGYKYDSEMDAVIFQWFVWKADESQLKNVFEAILYESGDIEFRYAMMDGYNVYDYDFGINMYDGPNWNLNILDITPFDLAFQSVYFSMEMMSDGAAIFAIAGEDMTATIDSSSFSHYMGGGVLLVAEDGLASIDLQGSDFSYIYATSQIMGAFVAAALDNLMTAAVTDCTFDTIATAAIVLFDAPDVGGVDSFVVENNHFNQVIITTAIVSLIDDEEYAGTGSYVSSKVFANNDGTHVGLMAMATIVIADDIAWNIQETDAIENNDFTGELDPWLLESLSVLTVPYLGDIDIELDIGMMNDIFIFESDIAGNQITHDVSVSGNTQIEGPVDEYFELGQPMDIGAVLIVEEVMLYDEADLTKQTSISVMDNVISAYYAPLVSGVEVLVAESLSNPVDGVLDSTINVNFVNNSMDSWYGYGVALGLAVMQQMNDGMGEGMLSVDVLATGNMIGGFGEGIFVAVDTEATNLFGDMVSNINVLIRDNEVYAYYDGIDVYLETSTAFEHYFPPYEQVVDSSAMMTIDVEIINNTLYSDDEGINVETSASATEDEYGVFTEAYASITGPVNILDNQLFVWDGYGIDVESFVSAYVSMATAMSDVPVTIVNNTIDSYYWDSTGIYVENSASASTLPLRFYDEPSALMLTNLNVMGNSIYCYSGIVIEQSSDATGGLSYASIVSDVSVTDNMVSGSGDLGISVDVSAGSHNLDYYPYATVDANVMITNNSVSGYGGTGIDVTVQPDVGEWYVDLSGSVMIVNNTVSGTSVGISADVVVQLDIVQNVVSIVEDGIVASAWDMSILENTITDVYDNGMVIDGSGLIENNTIVGAGSAEMNDAEGIYIEYGEYLTIQGNSISNVGYDGIHAVYLYDVLITSNTFENIGYSGVYLEGEEDTSYYLTISNNSFTNLGDSGIELNDTAYIDVLDNVMTNVSYYGIEIDNSAFMNIENNAMSMMYGGISLYDVYSANVMNNVMTAGAAAPVEDTEPALTQSMDDGYGIDVDDSYMVIVTMNEVTGFGEGVEFDDVSDLIFTWNVVTGSMGDGAYFYVEGATIADNVFSDNKYFGVVIEDSYLVSFANNEVMGNGLDGLLAIDNEDLTIVNGMFVDNGEYGVEVVDSPIMWIVNDASSVERNDVLFSGDLTVMAGGSLLLSGVEFIIWSEDGVSVIEVMEGGALTTVDVEFYMAEFDEPGIDFGGFYEFNVYGSLDMRNTDVSDALELLLGSTSTATIETSTIIGNVRNGIHIVDSAPVIRSCTISSNPRNGVLVEGSAAAPQISDCMIVNNDFGIYAVDATLELVTDNIIALNSEAGIFAENMNGRIHDNVLLLNNKEIYVRNSDVSIQDNQIGYTQLIQVIAQFVPLLQGFDIEVDIFLPELGLTISPSMVQGIMLGHVGLYAVDSTVSSSGNQFGMLGTAVQVVNTNLNFGDDIRQNTIILPYMDAGNIVRNMSLPIPVYDGIIATNSNVVINGGSIDVLDDAVFLDHSTANITSSTLKAMDFSLYLINDSNVTVTNSVFGKIKVDPSVLYVWEKLTVVIMDPWGAALANVPVKIGETSMTTDANGMVEMNVLSYTVTDAGRSNAAPYAITANLTDVPTTSYPGHASWSPMVLSSHATANGPTTVVLVPSVIIRFDLMVHAMDKDGKNAVNVTVMVFNAAGQLVTQAQSDANGTAAFELVSYIKNADGTTDSSMAPYKVTSDIGGKTAEASTNLTDNTNLDLKVVVTEFNWGPAIIMGVVALVMLLVAVYLLTRKK